jgi:hypothetical protein
MVASTEATSKQDVESDHRSQSGDSGDSETTSDNFRHVKVVAAAALVGISYHFGQSIITKTRLGSLECNARYFLKGYGRPLLWSLFLILGRMKLWCSRISLLLGFACHRILSLWTFCANSEYNYINLCRMLSFRLASSSVLLLLVEVIPL